VSVPAEMCESPAQKPHPPTHTHFINFTASLYLFSELFMSALKLSVKICSAVKRSFLFIFNRHAVQNDKECRHTLLAPKWIKPFHWGLRS
jgi:hypothetical protein